MSPLYSWLHQEAGRKLRIILDNTSARMSGPRRKELHANAPTDINERTCLIEIWIERLKLIKSGLESFPIPDSRSATSTCMPSPLRLPIGPQNPHSGKTLTPQENDIYDLVTACLQRDQYQCIITGRKFTDHSNANVVHIIPFSLANHRSCRGSDFWRMMEIFFGLENTDMIFEELLDRINGLENLITLDNSVCGMLNSGNLTLIPRRSIRDRIHVINDHIGNYWLEIRYPRWPELEIPEFIRSTKGLLLPGSRINLRYSESTPGDACMLPLPSSSYFALREFILSLKNDCANDAPEMRLGHSPNHDVPFIPRPVMPGELESGYLTYPTTCHSPSANQVLAAIAILEDMIDDGDLERSQ